MSDLGKSLLRGAQEALEYARGTREDAVLHEVIVPAQVDVAAIRKKMHMSRQEFCSEFGFSIRTVEKWERGERIPETSARAYLKVISNNPDAVMEALHQ